MTARTRRATIPVGSTVRIRGITLMSGEPFCTMPLRNIEIIKRISSKESVGYMGYS
jgi:hypothetical protein